MVFINKQALQDLDEIYLGLYHWDKVQLSIEFLNIYIDDIIKQCYELDELSIHFNTTFSSHKRFGAKVHRYRRNNQTTWYVIYNIDDENNIFVNKIISNYSTID